MGARQTKKCSYNKRNAVYTVLVLGLEGSGKTSIITQLRESKFDGAEPTLGYIYDKIELKSKNPCLLQVWDIGGNALHRELWPFFYQAADGVVYVVDSRNEVNLESIKHNVHNVFSHPTLQGIPFLVLCTKQDIKGSYKDMQLKSQLNLNNIQSSKWYIQGVSSKNRSTIVQGFDALVSLMHKRSSGFQEQPQQYSPGTQAHTN